MSRSSNSLRSTDVLATPIKLKYSSSYDSSSLNGYGITVLSGVNGPVTVTGSVSQETVNYRSIRNLYYSNYLTGSYSVSASAAENYLQSTAASGTLDADLRYFPTESNARITVLSIPRGVFGEKISRQSFIMSSSAYYIMDDGNGNIVDRRASNKHVGNIIYPQGMVIFTNSDYQDLFKEPPPAIVNWTRANYENNGFIADTLVIQYIDYNTKAFTTLTVPGGGTGTPPDAGTLTVVGGSSVFVSAQNSGFNNLYLSLISAAINTDIDGDLVSINIPIGSLEYRENNRTFIAVPGTTYTVDTYASGVLP